VSRPGKPGRNKAAASRRTPYSRVHLTDMLIYLVFMSLIRTKSYPLTHGKNRYQRIEWAMLVQYGRLWIAVYMTIVWPTMKAGRT
jgi:hypothetical protein